MIPTLAINRGRLLGEIEEISRISDVPPPAVTRVVYTPIDMRTRRYLQGLADAAELAWSEDALGNWFVRLPGTEPELPAVATGSHTDAIPYAGRFDGTVGVLGGLEILRTVKERGLQHRRNLELIMFTAEEPTRFGVGCLGSRALVGSFPLDAMRALRDDEGVSLDQARAAAGYAAALETVELSPRTYAHFIELHIEQGGRLEEAEKAIGIVTAIAASSTVRVSLAGDGGHAGTVLMPERREALAVAAELILLVERTARAHVEADGVGTVGRLQIHPGASNSIAGSVELTIDLRARETAVRDTMLETVHAGLAACAGARGVEVKWELCNSDPASRSDPVILESIARAADALGHSHMPLVSRAFHDTAFMALRFPTAMIFIPSFRGYSHRPDEYSSPEDIVAGVETLASSLLQLAGT